MKKVRQSNSQCHYWHEVDQVECTMTKGGLYIPMPEHIKMFCTTPKHTGCHQYIRGMRAMEEMARDELQSLSSRRRFHRVYDRLNVSVASCDDRGNPSDIIDENAYTLDVSPGGMRLECSKELESDNTLLFRFGQDFSEPSLAGIGKVKWVKTQPSSSNCQAGLAFVHRSTGQAIMNHLGITIM
ncbi:MAG: PilZ domain-containing protein [Desulfobulbaceae bacterium]|nr:PilZ domain-containing protein [Desulfobulbaceae bacterium]